MARTSLLPLWIVLSLSCAGGKPPAAAPASPAAPEASEVTLQSTLKPVCDYRIVAMSDPSQKQILCAGGESFVVRQGANGRWAEEMKTRAGTRPDYATPDEAARARCCPVPTPAAPGEAQGERR
jgi:hypothetical protein